ncbi:MAG: type VI secretion system-associated FHA domain protein TagH [Inquilinus limosus]|uniref:Type VI secretion system-associated FHA domain protein TagH n=1 Tax=Inquilinus limosus TaxID=171674 RepID=A0A952KFY7_9PROT|nr:type VI secretion system-associated FHA domain protein TagH [Inquilinus limosus]
MLTLSILRCPDGVPPETRQVGGGEFTIGRGTECNWVLPDPERVLSKRHCVVAFDGAAWQVTDTSTNGTFLNTTSDRLEADAPRVLRDGDRLVFGAYEIEAVFDRAPSALVPMTTAERPPAPRTPAEDRLTGDPFPAMGDDPLAVALPSEDGALSGGADGWSVSRFLGAPSSISDHAPMIQESFRPPRSSLELLPDDWDEEDSNQVAPASAEPPVPAPAPPAPASLVMEPLVVEPAPASPAAPAAAPPAPPPAAPLGSLEQAVAAFVEGAGLRGTAQGDPAEMLRGLGEAFRAMVVGLRRMMMARAAIKGEFRIEQTIIRPAGNNPLKFSADDEDALAGLLGVGRRSDMSARDAVADALRDMRLHELAVSAAMQQAVHHLVGELAPAQVAGKVEPKALDGLPGRRKARSWDAYQALHAGIIQALADDFDSVFGKSFARAYERAMAEVADRSDET